jgi:hypothetical protein
MAISGSWSARYANASAYTGALRWGTGINPIHAIPDNPGRVTGTKTNLYPLGEPSDGAPEVLIDADDYVCSDWDGEQPYPDEVFRYQEDLPRWDQTTPQFRDAIDSPAMGEHLPWGPDYPESDDFPLGGPTVGMRQQLDVDHGDVEEQQHAIAVPTRGLQGGWLNKARSTAALPAQETAQAVGDPAAQWAVNTGQVQGEGLKSSDNSRALARGTDSPRSSIQSRTAAMRAYSPATSFGMGGGPGTPDMQPFQQTAGLKRPFVVRQPTLPPFEEHTWNEMEGRVPLQRTVPPDPYQGDPETTGDTGGTDAIYDYGDGGEWF